MILLFSDHVLLLFQLEFCYFPIQFNLRARLHLLVCNVAISVHVVPFCWGCFWFFLFWHISSWESSSQGLFLRLGLEFPIISSLLVFFCFQVWASLFGHLLLRHQCSLLFFPSIASSLILGLISHAFTYFCGLELIDSFAFCLGFLSSLSLCYFFFCFLFCSYGFLPLVLIFLEFLFLYFD